MLNNRQTLNCSGKIVDISDPIVMGILNLTPDSFYDGGFYQSRDSILQRVEQMISEGAAIVDVGGMSTKPGSEVIETSEELERVINPVRWIHESFPETVISIDTVKSKVAEEAVGAGASIINDVSAGKFDDQLYETAGRLGVPYVLMHMQGTPQTMQQNPSYEDVEQDLMDFFIAEIPKLLAQGVKDIILDVGFGFGKTVDHNFRLLKNLEAFKILEFPVLVGLSRKSMVCKVLKVAPSQALNGSTALHMVSLLNGANILRVHDVKEAVQVIQLWKRYKEV